MKESNIGTKKIAGMTCNNIVLSLFKESLPLSVCSYINGGPLDGHIVKIRPCSMSFTHYGRRHKYLWIAGDMKYQGATTDKNLYFN